MNAVPEATRRIGVTVLTGFLGSGKTTLLNRLVSLPRFRTSLVIINEYGAVGVDHHLVTPVTGHVTVLAGGCLCCTIRGGLVDALREAFLMVIQRRIAVFDHVFIETSGMADATPVVFTLRHDFFVSQRFEYEGTIAVIGAADLAPLMDRYEVVRRQVALADLIVVRQPVGSDADADSRIETALRQINPVARVLCRADGSAWPELPSDEKPFWSGWGGSPHESSFRPRVSLRGVSHHGLFTFVVSGEEPWARAPLTDALDHLVAEWGDRLLRIKGVVRFGAATGWFIVQAVRHQRYPIEPLAPGSHPVADDGWGSLVFIVDAAGRADVERSVRERLIGRTSDDAAGLVE